MYLTKKGLHRLRFSSKTIVVLVSGTQNQYIAFGTSYNTVFVVCLIPSQNSSFPQSLSFFSPTSFSLSKFYLPLFMPFPSFLYRLSYTYHSLYFFFSTLFLISPSPPPIPPLLFSSSSSPFSSPWMTVITHCWQKKCSSQQTLYQLSKSHQFRGGKKTAATGTQELEQLFSWNFKLGLQFTAVFISVLKFLKQGKQDKDFVLKDYEMND